MNLINRNCCVFFALAFSILASLFFIASNFISPDAKMSSDFMVSFYTAGKLFRRGELQLLYPGPGCLSWQDAPINAIAHSMLPGLPASLTANFMYSPLVAAVFAPFSLAAGTSSLALWQVFNIVLLFCLPIILFGRERGRLSSDFAFSMSFAPVLATLWVGQCSLLFGVLPFALSLAFVNIEQFFLAGLVLSIMSLKPQLLIIAAVFAAYCPGRKQVFSGLVSGALLLFLLNLAVSSPQVLLNWLHSLTLSERFIGGGAYSMSAYLAASLPSALLLLLPAQSRQTWHLLVYSLSGLLAFALLFIFRRRLKALPFEKREALLPLCLFACIAELVMAPRFILYDASLLLVPLLLALRNKSTRTIAFALVAFVDAYVFYCLAAEGNPLLLIIGVLLLSLCMACAFKRRQDI